MKKNAVFDIVVLQAVVILYTFASVIGKFASAQQGMLFWLLYGAEVAVLGVYAILWQQMIRKFELSVAYANRAVALIWSLLWAVFFFQERLNVKKIAGVALVMIGVIVINGEREESTHG